MGKQKKKKTVFFLWLVTMYSISIQQCKHVFAANSQNRRYKTNLFFFFEIAKADEKERKNVQLKEKKAQVTP